MNNDGIIIRASDGPQMIREAKRLEQDLQAMQRKLGQLRRKLLLSSIEHCSCDSTLHEIWQKLKPEEQMDKEIIYKFLACYWCSYDTLFGRNPWCNDFRQPVKLPQNILSDPQAVLAFIANDRGSPTHSNWPFHVPQVLRDNKEVMMAVCVKFPLAFKQASKRLLDDEIFVQAVLLDANTNTRDSTIRHVSQRLLKDTNMWDYAESKGYCNSLFAQAWLESLDLDQMDIKEQKKIAHNALRCISLSCPHGSEEFELEFLSKLALELRDDAAFMLSFVEFDWTALQWCSHRLRSNMWHMDVVRAAVSKNINAYQYVEGPILEQYQRKRNVDVVLGELKQGLYLDNVPEHLLANRDVVKAAWKSENDLCFNDFPEALKHDKGFILDFIADQRGDVKVGNYFYSDLPVQLQTDEDVAKALLKAGFPSRVAILANVPSLLQSREAMMDAVAVSKGLYTGDEDEASFSEMVARCPFHIRNDEEFMLKAYEAEVSTFEHASERLRSNRRFLRRLLKVPKGDHQFITYTTAAFQTEHQDFILKVIKRTGRRKNYWLEDLNPAVWRNKKVVLVCLQKGWSIMELIRSSDPNSPHFSDKEVMFLSVKNRPADLKYASMNLREDREFILELVKATGRVLHHAPGQMKSDKEILLTAVARSSETISDCFHGFELENDFEFLCEFASEIRSAIATHQSFTEFLGGIYACHPWRPLSMLNLGSETGIALKKTIAEYAGVGFPMGSRLRTLKAALTNMEKLGY